MDTLDELIMTRVSHDLAGIAGALYNTAELMETDPTFCSEAGPLFKESTARLIARLKFFRALFGRGTATVDNALVTGYFSTLSAPFTLTGTVSTRAQMASVLICCDCMIRGGTITVQGNKVMGSGQIRTSNDLKNVLENNVQTSDPKLAPAVWLNNHYKTLITLTENQITLEIQN